MEPCACEMPELVVVARRGSALVMIFCIPAPVVFPSLLVSSLLRSLFAFLLSFFTCAVFAIISSGLDKRFEGGTCCCGYDGFHAMGRNGGTCQYEQWYERFHACVTLGDTQFEKNGLKICFLSFQLCSTCVKGASG